MRWGNYSYLCQQKIKVVFLYFCECCTVTIRRRAPVVKAKGRISSCVLTEKKQRAAGQWWITGRYT